MTRPERSPGRAGNEQTACPTSRFHVASISRFENGERTPPLSTLIELAGASGVNARGRRRRRTPRSEVWTVFVLLTIAAVLVPVLVLAVALVLVFTIVPKKTEK